MTTAVTSPMLIKPGYKSLQHLWDPNTTGVSYFNLREMAGLPVCQLAGGATATAVSNTGVWIRTGAGEGIRYIKANAEVTDFGTSMSFLPDPAVENNITLDLLFYPNRTGGAGTNSIWCKGNGSANNTSFCIGYGTTDRPFILFRFDSGGADEGGATMSVTYRLCSGVAPSSHVIRI